MPRLDRGIQYAAALVLHAASRRRALEYGIARSSGAKTESKNQKGGLKARRLQISPCLGWVPGRSLGSTRARRLLLLGFLRLLRLFRLLRFLSHSKSSQGLMDGNATRGMLGGGPASQHPRMQSQQIRRPLPRTVTPLSLRYPQLLCIFEFDFAKIFARHRPIASGDEGEAEHQHRRRARFRVNDAPTRGRVLRRSGTTNAHLHDFKTTVRIAVAAVRVR